MTKIQDSFHSLLKLNPHNDITKDLKTKYTHLFSSKDEFNPDEVAHNIHEFVNDPDTQAFLLSRPENEIEKLHHNIFDLAWRLGKSSNTAFDTLRDAANTVLQVKAVKSAQEFLKNLR